MLRITQVRENRKCEQIFSTTQAYFVTEARLGRPLIFCSPNITLNGNSQKPMSNEEPSQFVDKPQQDEDTHVWK